jgi:hypothetical protein
METTGSMERAPPKTTTTTMGRCFRPTSMLLLLRRCSTVDYTTTGTATTSTIKIMWTICRGTPIIITSSTMNPSISYHQEHMLLWLHLGRQQFDTTMELHIGQRFDTTTELHIGQQLNTTMVELHPTDSTMKELNRTYRHTGMASVVVDTETTTTF